MDQGRWKTVNHIFHAALEVSASERHSFVLTASEGDPDLQAEVELLLQADQDAGNYLESPLLPNELFSNSASPVNAGDVLCSRFRILRAVGEGGMGHVFEALDSELSVHVALKIIRPEIATNHEALARFRQEVRLARRITHPNVCRTFDIERETRIVDPVRGTKQEVVFLTMEFLQGETLASRIKRAGAIPLDEALHFARQVADALHAANALGIVHRDMKPANIMLVPAEASALHGFRAVITDFGLARIDAVVSSGARSALGHTARPIGTLAYMAPEQLEGSDVSPATDIYAFGLVLFEMSTGRRAFSSDNFLSGIAQRLTGPPPSPLALVPNLPHPWCRAIEGCLRLKPADRFQSAADVIDILDGSCTKLPSVGKRPNVQRLTLSSWPLPRRLLTLGAILLAAVALFVSGFRLYRSAADSKVTPGALVYLTQVRNQTGEKAIDNITELIQAGLAQSVQINLLDQARVGDILQQMTKAPDALIDSSTAREIAMRAGADRVVFAAVSESSGNYSLNVDIQQPDNTPSRYRDHWSKTFVWRTSGRIASNNTIPAELLTTIRSASNWIRFEVGESPKDITRLDVPPEDATTSNWEALADYIEAERFHAQGKKDEAVFALNEATRIDPGFTLAYARLGDILVSMYRPVEGYNAYLKALNQDSGRRLSRKERDFVLGAYASDTRDFKTALDAFRDESAFYPNDITAWFYQAYPLDMMDRPQDAIQALMRAEDLSSQTHRAAGGLAYSAMLMGEFTSAHRWIESVRQAGRADDATFLQALNSFLEGDYAGSERAFTLLQKSASDHSRRDGYSGLARVQAERGRYSEALATLTSGASAFAAAESDSDKGNRLLDEAYLECKLGHYERCLQDTEGVFQWNRSPDAIISASAIVGMFLPRMSSGTAQRARNVLHRMEALLPTSDPGQVFSLARARVRGEMFLSHGDSRNALIAFRKADSLDSLLGARDYLARAILAEKGQDNGPDRSNERAREALALYAKVALRPAAVWRQVMDYPPGFTADQMQAYLDLARLLQQNNSSTHTAENNLKQLRAVDNAANGR